MSTALIILCVFPIVLQDEEVLGSHYPIILAFSDAIQEVIEDESSSTEVQSYMPYLHSTDIALNQVIGQIVDLVSSFFLGFFVCLFFVVFCFFFVCLFVFVVVVVVVGFCFLLLPKIWLTNKNPKLPDFILSTLCCPSQTNPTFKHYIGRVGKYTFS